EPRADATGEGRGDVTIFDVELGVADLGFGVVDRGLRGELLGHALVARLGGSETASFQHLGANELAVGESEARGRGPELGGRLGELDLVGARIDDEKQVALVDDLPILEMELGERAADLRPQLDAVGRRKLAEETYPRVDLAQERRAHRHARRWHWYRGSLAALAVGETDPEECRERDRRRPHYPGPRPGSRSGRALSPFGDRPIADIIHLATPLIPKSPFAAYGEGTACVPVASSDSVDNAVLHRRRL